MTISKIDKNKVFPVGYCKKTTAGNTVEFLSMSSAPMPPPTLKLDADHYCNTNTGEVLEYLKSATRADNTDSLRKTFKRIRDLINANCTEPEKLHWITLTYAENMTDTTRLYNDFSKFWKRFKRFCAAAGHNAPEYITIIEPQARGAWHCHCLFVWDKERPFVENKALADMWEQGFVKIKSVTDCDNLGAYLSAYLGDIPLENGENPKGEIKEVNGKRYLKGGRLHLYPVGVNIVRTSRKIKKPLQELVPPEAVDADKVMSGLMTFKTSYKLQSDETSRFLSKEYYNTKRPITQAQALLQHAVGLGIVIKEVNA